MKYKKKKYIANIFKINESNLKNNQIKYFYTKRNELCCNFKNLKPFFNDIEEYEYKKLAIKINELYKDNKYNKFIVNFLKHISSLKIDNQPLKIFNNDIYLNYLMVLYTQCRKKIKKTTIWPISNITNNNLNKKFKDRKIYAIKKIKLTSKAVQNLIYQMYAYTNEYKTIDDIKEYSKKLGWTDEKKVKYIKIYLYEGNDLNIDESHTTNTFMEAIVLTKIYFNKNSIDFLHLQLLDRVISSQFRQCKILLNTYINYLYSNIDLFDIDKFLILSGAILFTYGIRRCSDIDFFIGDNPSYIRTDNFIEKIDNFYLNEKTKFFFTDGYTKLIPDLYWKNFWEEWHIEWANLFGAEHISETIFNPEYHYYYMGLKLLYLDADIARRNVRGRPAAVADLIMINRLLGKNININPIPKKTIRYDVITEISKNKFINTIKFWLKKKYRVNEKPNNLKKIVKFI